MSLTWEEQRDIDRQGAAAQKKLAEQRAAETKADDDWNALTRSYWPDEAAAAIVDAEKRLQASELSQAEHEAFIVSNARTRTLATTPEAVRTAFDTQLAVARRDNATAVDSLNEAQFDALWESMK